MFTAVVIVSWDVGTLSSARQDSDAVEPRPLRLLRVAADFLAAFSLDLLLFSDDS
jgi:hypothetical protein